MIIFWPYRPSLTHCEISYSCSLNIKYLLIRSTLCQAAQHIGLRIWVHLWPVFVTLNLVFTKSLKFGRITEKKLLEWDLQLFFWLQSIIQPPLIWRYVYSTTIKCCIISLNSDSGCQDPALFYSRELSGCNFEINSSEANCPLALRLYSFRGLCSHLTWCLNSTNIFPWHFIPITCWLGNHFKLTLSIFHPVTISAG